MSRINGSESHKSFVDTANTTWNSNHILTRKMLIPIWQQFCSICNQRKKKGESSISSHHITCSLCWVKPNTRTELKLCEGRAMLLLSLWLLLSFLQLPLKLQFSILNKRVVVKRYIILLYYILGWHNKTNMKPNPSLLPLTLSFLWSQTWPPWSRQLHGLHRRGNWAFPSPFLLLDPCWKKRGKGKKIWIFVIWVCLGVGGVILGHFCFPQISLIVCGNFFPLKCFGVFFFFTIPRVCVYCIVNDFVFYIICIWSM